MEATRAAAAAAPRPPPSPPPAAAAAADALSALFDFCFEEFRRSVDSFCGASSEEAGDCSSSSTRGPTGSLNGSLEGSAQSSSTSSSGIRQSALFQVLQLPAEVLQALAAAGDLQQLADECSSSSTTTTTSSTGSSSSSAAPAGEVRGDAARQQDVKSEELLLCMRHCARLAERCGVVSPNEELDDIPTKNLKYLLLPYLLGRLSLECTDMQRRLSRMQEAQIYLREFMAAAERLRFGRPEDVRAFETVLEELQQQSEAGEEKTGGGGGGGGGGGRAAAAGPSGASMSAAAAARNELIARAKYEKQLDARLTTLFQRRRAAAAENGEETEEEERDLWISLLARAAAASSTHLSLMAREIPMLLMRRQHEEEQLRRRGKPGSAAAAATALAAANQHLSGTAAQAAANKKPWFCVVRDRSELRQLYRAKVFTPGHNLPTMSLAECAAIEMEMEVNQIGARKSEVVREYPTTEARAEAEEEEERQQREWDNWKDEHPRGSGNKMRNKG